VAPTRHPFDAVILVGFGGPQSLDDIRPFLANVLRGRRIPQERLDDVVHHYEMFDGVSPLTAITMRQADGLRRRLADTGVPVYVGMRNWHPFLEDTFIEMAEAGVRRALALPLAAHHSYSSCGQYKANVTQALSAVSASGRAAPQVTYVPGWHKHEGFIDANARHITDALETLPTSLRDTARIAFTAHSIPETMARESRYEAELNESAALVAGRLGRRDWTLVFQSRSGRPQDPWLGPDICDYLRTEHDRGLRAVVVSPIGFVADHVEVLYDLDHEAAGVCRDVGIEMRRAASVNDDPAFLDALSEVVEAAIRRYALGLPLPIVPATAPARTEPPPPMR
jgi:ferrochelatase